ncbi:MAG: hypothetical protein ABIT76_08765 [Chthoniobacterales bacterium]
MATILVARLGVVALNGFAHLLVQLEQAQHRELQFTAATGRDLELGELLGLVDKRAVVFAPLACLRPLEEIALAHVAQALGLVFKLVAALTGQMQQRVVQPAVEALDDCLAAGIATRFVARTPDPLDATDHAGAMHLQVAIGEPLQQRLRGLAARRGSALEKNMSRIADSQAEAGHLEHVRHQLIHILLLDRGGGLEHVADNHPAADFHEDVENHFDSLAGGLVDADDVEPDVVQGKQLAFAEPRVVHVHISPDAFSGAAAVVAEGANRTGGFVIAKCAVAPGKFCADGHLIVVHSRQWAAGLVIFLDRLENCADRRFLMLVAAAGHQRHAPVKFLNQLARQLVVSIAAGLVVAEQRLGFADVVGRCVILAASGVPIIPFPAKGRLANREKPLPAQAIGEHQAIDQLMHPLEFTPDFAARFHGQCSRLEMLVQLEGTSAVPGGHGCQAFAHCGA